MVTTTIISALFAVMYAPGTGYDRLKVAAGTVETVISASAAAPGIVMAAPGKPEAAISRLVMVISAPATIVTRAGAIISPLKVIYTRAARLIL